jgi:hypothetical protein
MYVDILMCFVTDSFPQIWITTADFSWGKTGKSWGKTTFEASVVLIQGAPPAYSHCFQFAAK